MFLLSDDAPSSTIPLETLRKMSQALLPIRLGWTDPGSALRVRVLVLVPDGPSRVGQRSDSQPPDHVALHARGRMAKESRVVAQVKKSD